MSSINKTTIQEIGHKELVEIVIRCHEVKQSIFVQGGIGYGKSTSVEQAGKDIAKDLNIDFVKTKNPNEYPTKFCLVDLRLAQKDAGEILGLPETYALVERKVTETVNKKPVEVTKIEPIPLKVIETILKLPEYKESKIVDYVTKWSMPSWYPRSGHGIIFVDEFNLAPPLVQYAMYELINDRCLGDYKLPDGWSVVGAGNRGIVDGSPVFEFPSPLNNRFMWYELRMPKVEEWTEWAMNNGVDFRVISYLQTKRSHLATFDHKNKEKAFATPRSWVKASEMIKGLSDERKIELYIAGLVGKGVAGEFKAFLVTRRTLPPTEKFIKNPSKMAIPDKDDLLYTLCCNLVEYLLGVKDKKAESTEALTAITIFSSRLWKEAKKMEFCVFLLKLVKSTDPTYFSKNIITIKEFAELSTSISKFLL